MGKLILTLAIICHFITSLVKKKSQKLSGNAFSRTSSPSISITGINLTNGAP